jgi:DNA repair exonuclease SbcCD nuclease subunit
VLRFLHLSDLHFGQARHKPNEKSYEMCHVEFLDDCKKWLAGKSAGKADAVLITGDVAYSGSVEEYGIAANAIKEICTVVGTERVLIVPGNHDVDRSFVNLPELRLHEAIREASEGGESDNLYQKLLLNQNRQYDVNKKLSNFSKFVEQHGWKGVVNASKEPWFEDLEIKSNHKIRIHGLCSVFVCNDRDDVNKMVLGPTQWYSSKLVDAPSLQLA